MGSAFTTSNVTLVKQLRNDVTIKYNDAQISVKALWDTGATTSCISEYVVKKLALVPTGRINIATPSSVSERNTYLVDIILPNNFKVCDLMVVDSEIGAQNIGMLIGMDIIMQGDFSVSNYNKQTVFTFRVPSEEKTDYVKEMRIANVVGLRHGSSTKKYKPRKR